jgi:hypothetical protein
MDRVKEFYTMKAEWTTHEPKGIVASKTELSSPD